MTGIINITKSLYKYKIQWYKKKVDSAQDYLLSIIKDYEILIHRHTNREGRQWGITTPENLLQHIESNKYLYEVIITDRKRKLYFDIDIIANKQGVLIDTLEECKQLLYNTFPDAILSISGSKTEYKISYHIIIHNWYANNVNEMECLQDFCTKYTNLGFDDKVYTKNRNMKIINQSKPDGRIQEIIEDITLKNHLITCYFNENSKHISESIIYYVKEIIQNKKEYSKDNSDDLNLGDINQEKISSPETFNYHTATHEQILHIIPLYPRYTTNCLKYAFIYHIMIWSKQSGIHFETFWEWCKQKEDSKNRYKKYYDLWNDCSKNVRISKIEAILLRFYPDILKNVATKQFNKQFDFNDLVNHRIVKDSYLNENCLDSNVKWTVLGSGMGTNKTGTIVNALKGEKVLWLTSRITLSQNVLKRLNEEGLKFVNYRDFTVLEKNKGVLENHSNVICSVQSLHYLCKNNFTVIVIDESESVLNTFNENATTHAENCIINWEFLKDFLRDSKKVFLMDAFTTRLTIDFVNSLKIPNDIIDYITVSEVSKERQFLTTEKYTDFVQEIINALKSGKKIFVFTPFKTGAKGVVNLTECIKKELGWIENKEIITYYAEKSNEKKQLYNCESVWGNPEVKCILTNSCITIGVNFNESDVFDQVFCYYSYTIPCRDFIQALYRVRHPKTTEMIFCAEKQIFKSEYVPSKYTSPICEVYKQVQKNLLIEDLSNRNYNNLETLQMFCKKANIIFKMMNIIKTNRQNRATIQRLLKESDTVFKWESVKDITEKEMAHLGDILNSNLETLDDRLQFDKYNFKQLFEDPEIAKNLWNKRKQKLVNRIVEFVSDPNNIIRRIYDLNKMELNKEIKSNPELHTITTSEINDVFKFEKKPSNNHVHLIMKAINAYFEDKDLITVEKNETGEKTIYKRITINGKQYLKYKMKPMFIKDTTLILNALKKELFVEKMIEYVRDFDY